MSLFSRRRCVTSEFILTLIRSRAQRYFDTNMAVGERCHFPPKISTQTTNPSKKRRLPHISARSALVVRASEKNQLSLIGSQPRDFQEAGEVRSTLPL